MTDPGRLALIVCGGRDYSDRPAVDRALDHASPAVVVSGRARGADRLGADWALERGCRLVEVPALWDAHGRGAGPRRNEWMLVLLQALQTAGVVSRVGVVAFPGGKGTAQMVGIAEAAGVGVWRPT